MLANAKVTAKFVVPSALVVLVLLGAGVAWIGARQKADALREVERQARLIEAQVSVTRAYITDRYVAAISAAGLDERVDVPRPATAVIETTRQLAEQGWFQARLISANPVNPANRPRDEFERAGLKALAGGQGSFERLETVGGKLMYRRITPDLAVSEACLQCHPGHKVGDVLGALTVSIPYAEKAAALRADAYTLAGLTLVMAAAIALLLWIMIRRVVISPLHSLVEGTAAVAAGNLTAEVRVGARDEFGQLAETFNQMSQSLRYRFRQLQALLDVSRTLSASLDPGEVLSQVLYSGVDLLDARHGAVFLLDPEGEPRLESFTGGEEEASALGIMDITCECIARPVTDPNPVVIDAGRCPDGCGERAVDHGCRWILSIPLPVEGRVIGMAVFYSPHRYTAEQIELTEALGRQAALAIRNAMDNRKLHELAERDMLTGLANRRAFWETLTRVCDRAAQGGGKVTLLMVDLDHFKEFNDRYGHLAGDALLAAVGRAMRESVRSTDLPCRYGGDEFTVILPGADEADALQVIERLNEKLTAMPHPEGAPPGGTGIHVSIGVAVYPDDAADGAGLVSAADRAMYEAKACSRERITVVRARPVA